jgi:hypothetical protein
MSEYSHPDPKVRVVVASDDNAPAGVLEKLSQDPDSEVRRAVAGNPNTPIEILENLGEQFPEAVTDNPIFNLLLLENPDGEFVRLSLARSCATFEDILYAIAFNKSHDPFQIYQILDRYLRRLVAEYPKTFFLILKKSGKIKDIYTLRVINKILLELTGDRNAYLKILEKQTSDRTRF